MAAFRGALARRELGTGCIRYRRPDAIDIELVGEMGRATAASGGPAC